MKKLVIILWLIISTVAFGKPAYKQWKKERVDFKRLSSSSSLQVANFYNCEYVTVMNKKSDWMSLALYISTNRLSDGIADVFVSLATTEPIDFSVGTNTIRLQSTELRASFKFITNINGVYSYRASITNVSFDDIIKSHGLVHVGPTFKYPALINLTTDGYFGRLENEMEKEREEQAKILKIKQNRDRFEALKKRYNIKYSATLNGYEVYSKKANYGTGLHARFGLLVREDTSGLYEVSYLQFMLLNWQVVPYIMSVGAFYTEDGEYVIRRPLGTGYVGELGWKRPNGQVQYGFNYYILYGKSDNLQYLEKMVNSGEKLWLEFGGQGVETIKHWLYGVEIIDLKDLINFIKELHGEGL